MSDVFAYLKSHPDLQNLSANPNQRLLLIELSEQRFAAVLLRPSTIWKFAVVLGQIWQSVSWATAWRTAASQVSGEDARDLRRNGETPFGISIVEPLTREMNLLVQSPNLRNVDFVLPVGTLSQMKNLIWLLRDKRRFPRAKILESQPQLMLPNDLNVPNLRAAIARVWLPKVDATYTLKTVKMVSTAQSAHLGTEATPLINQGAAPPTQANPIEGINRKKLFRAISSPPGQIAPIYLIIQKGDTSVHARCGEPSFNRFFLNYWINYSDDTLGIQVTDDKGDEIPAFNPVSPQEAERAIADLPTVESIRYLDIAFIVDGTMPVPADKNWKPDLEPARKFLDGLLDDLQKDKSLNARVALCVYGDSKEIAGTDFDFYTLPSHVKDFWCEPRILQREIQDLAKFKGTFDLDYEALLETGLYWANTLQWRQDATRHVVVIGSAPPHLPNTDPYYPPDSGLTHEPFTSHFNYRDELKRLRGDPNSPQRTHIWAVWVPYPELKSTHPCQAWSKRIWDEVADHNPDAFIKGLSDDTRKKLFERIKTHTPNRYVTRAPIPLPFTQQEYSLRWMRAV